MMDMTVGTMAIVGLVLLLVVVVGLYVAFRVLGGRAHDDQPTPRSRPPRGRRRGAGS